jgi:hypothetical protein
VVTMKSAICRDVPSCSPVEATSTHRLHSITSQKIVLFFTQIVDCSEFVIIILEFLTVNIAPDSSTECSMAYIGQTSGSMFYGSYGAKNGH